MSCISGSLTTCYLANNEYRHPPLVVSVILIITGIVVAILGGVHCFGPLNSYGSIISISTGAIVATVGLIACAVICIKKYLNHQEELQHVRWFCDNGSTRKKLASLIRENELSQVNWDSYNPAPQEKIVLAIKVIPNSILNWSDPDSIAAKIVQKYQTETGNRFLVLFDVSSDSHFKLPKSEPWQKLACGNQCLRTDSSDWRRKLVTFISS